MSREIKEVYDSPRQVLFTDETTSRLTSDPLLTDATVESGSRTVNINSGATARHLARERTIWTVV